MSQSKAKLNRTKEANTKREDLEKQIEAATKAAEAKIEAAKAHFLAQTQVAASKYLTVNGYMMARTTLMELGCPEEELEPNVYCLAQEMHDRVEKIAADFQTADYKEYGVLFDQFIDYEFIKEEGKSRYEIAEQLLTFQMAQTMDDALDDIVSFAEHSEAEIAKLTEELAAL